MAEGAALPVPWRPGGALQYNSSLADICAALDFGCADTAYGAIAAKLATRNCTTKGDLEDWGHGEVISLVRPLQALGKLKKRPEAYVAALAHATDIKFTSEVKAEIGTKVKAETGGDHSTKCTKILASATFSAYKYLPDGRIYAGVPTTADQETLDEDEEKLYLDSLWIDAIANPEPSMGDYIPSGLAMRYRSLHKKLKLAPLTPAHAGKMNETERDVKRAAHLRFQNGRQGLNGRPYKRMVFDEKYKEHITTKAPKAAQYVNFVSSLSEELQDNKRNDLLGTLLKVYSGELPAMQINFPEGDARAQFTEVLPKDAGKDSSDEEEDKEAAKAAAERLEAERLKAEKQERDELDALDGAVLPDCDAPLPSLPSGKKRCGGEENAHENGARTKKQKEAGKKSAKTAVAGGAAGDSSDDEAAHAAPPPKPPKPPAPPKPPKQTTLTPKLALSEIPVDHPAVNQPAVEPPLSPVNAATRFVFVPAEQFGSEGIGGWIAKITKVGKQQDPIVDIQFKDADGKLSKQYFKFSHVKTTFKPLSAGLSAGLSEP